MNKKFWLLGAMICLVLALALAGSLALAAEEKGESKGESIAGPGNMPVKPDVPGRGTHGCIAECYRVTEVCAKGYARGYKNITLACQAAKLVAYEYCKKHGGKPADCKVTSYW